MSTDKLTYRVDEAMRATGLGRSKIYELIKSGRLTTVKVGSRTLIKRDSLLALVK